MDDLSLSEQASPELIQRAKEFLASYASKSDKFGFDGSVHVRRVAALAKLGKRTDAARQEEVSTQTIASSEYKAVRDFRSWMYEGLREKDYPGWTWGACRSAVLAAAGGNMAALPPRVGSDGLRARIWELEGVVSKLERELANLKESTDANAVLVVRLRTRIRRILEAARCVDEEDRDG